MSLVAFWGSRVVSDPDELPDACKLDSCEDLVEVEEELDEELDDDDPDCDESFELPDVCEDSSDDSDFQDVCEQCSSLCFSSLME